MEHSNKRTLTLGPEYDKATRMALRAVLLELGALLSVQRWGLGGSQEVETMLVRIKESEIVVEAETYIGLTITGDEDLVTLVGNLVSERLKRSAGLR